MKKEVTDFVRKGCSLRAFEYQSMARRQGGRGGGGGVASVVEWRRGEWGVAGRPVRRRRPPRERSSSGGRRHRMEGRIVGYQSPQMEASGCRNSGVEPQQGGLTAWQRRAVPVSQSA